MSVTGLNEAVAKIVALQKSLPERTQKRVLKKAANILLGQAILNAPKGDKAHKRYSTAKATGKLRAPAGSGNVVATYQPGNLKNSLEILPLRRIKGAVMVGPKAGKGLPDGYYAHFTEFGTYKQTPQGWMEKAVNLTKGTVRAEIIKGLGDAVKRAAKK